MKKNRLVAPVLKWVGGKRQLISDIEPLIPRRISTYVEPFIGGGAILFHLQPKKAVINDYNQELMNVYQVIKDNPDGLIEVLKRHKELHSEEYFYEVRSLDRSEDYENMSDVEKAGRIIYLNKTCYNGLFRVNRAGFFNTPYGKYKNPSIVNEVTIRAISNYFNSANVKFLTGDYKEALKRLRRGAFVYFDPPYINKANRLYKNSLVKKDHIEIAEAIKNINNAKWIITYDDTEIVRLIYSEYYISQFSIQYSAATKKKEKELLILKDNLMKKNIQKYLL